MRSYFNPGSLHFVLFRKHCFAILIYFRASQPGSGLDCYVMFTPMTRVNLLNSVTKYLVVYKIRFNQKKQCTIIHSHIFEGSILTRVQEEAPTCFLTNFHETKKFGPGVSVFPLNLSIAQICWIQQKLLTCLGNLNVK